MQYKVAERCMLSFCEVNFEYELLHTVRHYMRCSNGGDTCSILIDYFLDAFCHGKGESYNAHH